MESSMQKLLPFAALVGGLALSGAAGAQNYHGSDSDMPRPANAASATSMREPMVINVDRGTVREKPNPTAHLVTTLPRGYPVMVVGTANGGGWAHVLVDGLSGFIDFVQLEKAPATESRRAVSPGDGSMMVAVNQGNLRERPSVQSGVLASLPRGERVMVIGTANGGGWAHVMARGLEGYMDFVQLADIPAQPYAAAYQTNNPSYPVYQNTYPANQSRDMIVNAAGGTVHESPSSNSRLLAVLSPGQHVGVVGSADGGAWAHVISTGLDGYMDYQQLQ
jgi:uncharacterized protein YgiM (DUF1202 family)